MTASPPETPPSDGAAPRPATLVARLPAGLVLVAVYVATGVLGLTLSSVGRDVTLLWPPAGVAVAALLVMGVWTWPAVFVGAWITNAWWAGTPWLPSAGVAAGNTLEVVVVVAVLRRAGFRVDMARAVDVGWLGAAGVLLGPPLAAAVGTATLTLGGKIPVEAWGRALTVWWLGDGTSVLVMVPALLALHRRNAARPDASPRVPLQRVVLLVVLTAAAFVAPFPPLVGPLVTSLLPLGGSLALAMAHGPGGAAAGALGVNATAFVMTAAGLGPFAADIHADGAVALWVQFLLTSMVPQLVAILREDERRVHAQLDDALAVVRAGRERLALVLDGVEESILAVTGPGDTVVFANRAALQLLGLTEAELAGRSASAWIQAPSRDGGGGVRGVLPARVTAADGTLREVEMGVSAAGADGLRIWVLRDVTARNAEARTRQALEDQLRHAQRMESVGQLAGGVAHDFNNVLQIIVGAVSLARDVPGLAPAALRELDVALTAAHRAAGLTRQLLAYAQRQALQRRPMDLRAVVMEGVDLGRRVLGPGITVEVRAPARLPDILADAGQVEQVLLNLLLNARDAMSAHGVITVELVHRAAGDGAADAVLMTVADTGHGMDEATRQRAVQPFFTTRDRARSSGLGLSVVDGIVRQHGGTLALDSAPGKGTVVSVTWPCPGAAPLPREAHAAAPPPPPTPVMTASAGTVLLAEDDDGIRALVERALVRRGWKVVCAVDGQQAVELAQDPALELHAAVLDVKMPRLDGRAALEAIRGARPRLPAVLCSGYADGLDAAGADEGGPTRFLEKPYVPADLLRALEGVRAAGAPPADA